MFPWRDNIPARRLPIVTLLLIAANVAVFLYQWSLGPDSPGLQQFVVTYGLVPQRITDAGWSAAWPGMLTAMFLHGGWLHLLGNMWYLWLFGDNVEDVMGPGRYIGFYLLGGFAAGLAQYAIAPDSAVPMVGASGAIAAVLGGYLLTFPRARVATLVIVFYFIELIELPAVIVLGGWFLMQLLAGVASLGVQTADVGGVAFWAHIGGFVFGTVAVRLFRKHPPPSPQPIRRHRWTQY
jgi:membrane associated rhomboid family serine protease